MERRRERSAPPRARRLQDFTFASSLNGLNTFKPGRRKSLSLPVTIVLPVLARCEDLPGRLLERGGLGLGPDSLRHVDGVLLEAHRLQPEAFAHRVARKDEADGPDEEPRVALVPERVGRIPEPEIAALGVAAVDELDSRRPEIDGELPLDPGFAGAVGRRLIASETGGSDQGRSRRRAAGSVNARRKTGPSFHQTHRGEP